MSKKPDFKAIKVKGKLSSTSNQISEYYSQEIPTKTVYIDISEHTAKKLKNLKDFGLPVYTSEEGDNFLIVKAKPVVEGYENTEKVAEFSFKIYDNNDNETHNLMTKNEVIFNITKVIPKEKNRNAFFRLSAISMDSVDDLIIKQPENPFDNELTVL